jgi:hypothetical protein
LLDSGWLDLQGSTFARLFFGTAADCHFHQTFAKERENIEADGNVPSPQHTLWNCVLMESRPPTREMALGTENLQPQF